MEAKTKKGLCIGIVTVVLLLSVFVYIKFFFVFGEGVKAGDLNYIVHKGYIFKTWEGKVLQSGFSSKTTGPIQSYEFVFSVIDEAVADSLMKCSGKQVELHYKEYLGTLPWRGMQKHVVDSIISVKEN